MVQHYISTEQLHAWPQAKDDEEGYVVQYPDGHTSWRTKADFEAEHLAVADLSNLPARLQRVTLERALIEANLASLQAFLATELFANLPLADRTLMERQVNAMTVYSRVTALRMAGFPSYLDESQGIKFVEYFRDHEIAQLTPEERTGMFGYDPLVAPAA